MTFFNLLWIFILFLSPFREPVAAELPVCLSTLTRLFGADYESLTRTRDYARLLGLDEGRSLSSSSAAGFPGFDKIYEEIHSRASFENRKLLGYSEAEWQDLNEEQKKQALFGYLDGVFARYNPKHLQVLQNRSLRESLERHGVRKFDGSARKTLEKLSRQNVERMLGDRIYIRGSHPDMAGLEELVDHLELIFPHYSHINGNRITPTVSSRQLEKMGFPGGANTVHAFNREFLRSDDNVYFYARFSPKGQKFSQEGVVYGNEKLFLNKQYAYQNGWLSPDMMYDGSLQTVGELVAPQAWERFRKKYVHPEPEPDYSKMKPEYRETAKDLHELAVRKDPEGIGYSIGVFFPTERHIVKQIPQELVEIRESTHKLDFTAADYERLAKESFLYRMNLLRQKDPALFQQKVRTFREDPEQLSGMLDNSAGIFSPEFKIPVAVPPDMIK